MAKKKAVESSSSKSKRAPRGSVAKPSKVDNAVVAGGQMTEANKKTSSTTSRTAGLSGDLIGQTAGDVWRVLSERGGHTVAGLKKSLDVSDELVLAAVGWLAREDKLAFETNGRSVTVSLV